MKRPDLDIPRLVEAMRKARQTLRNFREERRHAVRQFVGQHWSEEGTEETVPINLLAVYVGIVGRNLLPKNPRVMLSTFTRDLKPTVSAMEAWANKEIEGMKLASTLQRVVVDALFSVGICKVALASPANAASVAWNLRAGQPFAERVDLDDFVFDVHARSFDEVGYIGHRFRVPLDVVRDSRIYSKARKDLTASEDNPFNLEGDERVSVLGRGYYSNHEEWEDMVDLWEIYLPRHRLIITLDDNHLIGPEKPVGARSLREQSWLGPETGPYHMLGFGTVPGNAMPKAPIQDLVDLHEPANRAYRKLIRAIDRLKENTLVRASASEDGERLLNAIDGQMIPVMDAGNVSQVVQNGNHADRLLLMANAFIDRFSWQAGNLDIMGGLSPQSKTATQDRMLDQNSSRSVNFMQDMTIGHVADVIKSLCWYWWHDPFKVQTSTHALPGLPDLQILRQVTPQMRKMGRFEDLDIRVDPYSLQHQTPQMRMQFLMQTVTQVIAPMLPLFQAQGVNLDLNKFLQKLGAYADQPDLGEILTIQEPPGELSSPESSRPTMPAQTERKYVRENRPERTRQGNDLMLQNALMGVKAGGNPNGQANGVMR